MRKEQRTNIMAIRGRERERGVVIVLVMLALVLLGAIVFYLFNTGRNLQAKVVTQNAADAAVTAGATEVARAMNTVAMNNVEMTRVIAAINVEDAMPQAIDFVVTHPGEEDHGQLNVLSDVIRWQLNQGVSHYWVRELLEIMYEREQLDGGDYNIRADLDRYTDLDHELRHNALEVIQQTHYDTGEVEPDRRRGRYWQVLESLDQMNQKIMQDLPLRAQTAAVEAAEANIRDSVDGTGVLLPVWEEMPWKRGVFDDFERPVKKGMLPGNDSSRVIVSDRVALGLGQVDHDEERRGPWDTVFGWRVMDADPVYFSGGLGYWPHALENSGRTPEWYRTFGPRERMMQMIPSKRYHRLRYWADVISWLKMGYVWPKVNDDILLVKPDWEADMLSDNERSHDGDNEYIQRILNPQPDDEEKEIRETMFVVCEVKSKVAGSPNNESMRGVTWNYVDRRNTPVPIVRRYPGWVWPTGGSPERMFVSPDPKDPAPIWRKLGPYMWEWQHVMYTDPDGPDRGGDPEVDLPPLRQRNEEGEWEYVAQRLYYRAVFMFVGVNVGLPVKVRDPYAGFSPNDERSPAPIGFDHDKIDVSDEATQDSMHLLSIVRHPNKSAIWPSRFDKNQSYDQHVGLAQARVFNNHSFDLWTQMWHVGLEPVGGMKDWVDQLEDELPQLRQIPVVRDEGLEELLKYMRSVEPLEDVMLHH
ncbi:pilus assembly protein TadG-related protein [Poriferisphaera sp. WC338]|uniref:pilus assembly protein TadG-related protein n=1 Tax=Poriferisphaera sp. WC338 TaxID=3425129 RepID=UPI003D815EE4